jgi:tRNA pseudouridine55 synthase
MLEAGVFLIDKPVGPSSFKMVQLVRRALQIKKVGHTGTLDPFASGLLIVCAGRPATKIISQLMAGDKEYEAVLKLGVETETFDTEGEVVATHDVPALTSQQIEDCLAGFQGEQLQVPPQYSALKHKGKPLYYYARKGVKIEKEPRPVQINEIGYTTLAGDELTIQVRCGKGTYIRTLAADIGKELGCGAHLTQLRRLANGPFLVGNSINGDELFADRQKAREKLLGNCFSVSEALKLI